MKSQRHLNITLIYKTETTEDQTLWPQWMCKEDPRIHLTPLAIQNVAQFVAGATNCLSSALHTS